MSKIRLHGSSSGYTEIAPVAASGNNTLTLPNDGTIISKDAAGAIGVTSVHTTNITTTGIATITTAKIGAGVTITESGIEASGIGITVANINGGSIGGRRNIIINGDMRIAQRGTSRSSTTQGASHATVDRFQLQWNNFSVAAVESQGDVGTSDTPYTLGFRKYHRITLASAGTASGSTYVEYLYKVEAQDMATSGWNYTSPSSFITLSFWFRCSTNQTFYGVFRTADGTGQGYAFSFTATGNNEWTKVIKTIPGNSNITINNDNGVGLSLYIFPALGTSYTDDSKSLNSWGTFANSSYCPDMSTTWLTAGASTFDLTGVQLEVGSQATSFEHRSHGDELELCKRYYEQFNSEGLTEAPFGVGYFESDTQLRAVVPLHEKRADVSFSSTAASTFASMNTNNMPAGSSISLYKTGKKAAIIMLVLGSSVTSGDGRAGILCAQSSTEATLKFSAEL